MSPLRALAAALALIPLAAALWTGLENMTGDGSAFPRDAARESGGSPLFLRPAAGPGGAPGVASGPGAVEVSLLRRHRGDGEKRSRPERAGPRRAAEERSRRRTSRRRPGLAPVPRVQMRVDTNEVSVGDTVLVKVWISGVTDVGSVPFHVLFDPAVLRFERGIEGPFLGGDGRQTVFAAAPTRDRTRVVVGLSRLGRGQGLRGSGELCVLEFTAVGAGDAGLSFARARVWDSENRIVPATFDGAVIGVR